jgi:hypothetical protein
MWSCIPVSLLMGVLPWMVLSAQPPVHRPRLPPAKQCRVNAVVHSESIALLQSRTYGVVISAAGRAGQTEAAVKVGIPV